MTVSVLTIDNDGSRRRTMVFKTQAEAMEALAQYCRDDWDTIGELTDRGDEPPEDDDAVIEQYFEAADNETYDISMAELDVVFPSNSARAAAVTSSNPNHCSACHGEILPTEFSLPVENGYRHMVCP